MSDKSQEDAIKNYPFESAENSCVKPFVLEVLEMLAASGDRGLIYSEIDDDHKAILANIGHFYKVHQENANEELVVRLNDFGKFTLDNKGKVHADLDLHELHSPYLK